MNKEITTNEFNTQLYKILATISAKDLIALIPDIYSDVSEYFNNEVIRQLEEKQSLMDNIAND